MPSCKLHAHFQSPLHRGTGFNILSELHGGDVDFQSPLHRGTGFNAANAIDRVPFVLSVPSSSGHRFQPYGPAWRMHRPQDFQSPLHRGTGFNDESPCGCCSSQHFSPLFIGAQVSTASAVAARMQSLHLSVPSSSGHRFQPVSIRRTQRLLRFQSPLHRGTGFNICRMTGTLTCGAFSPLFIGAQVSTCICSSVALQLAFTFSPLFIGAQVST